MTSESIRAVSQFDDPDESTGLLLWRVTNAWQAAMRATLKPFNLTHVQFVLLASLTWLQDSELPTQQQLAEFCGVDAMMASQVLRALESNGLLVRRSHPSDGRAKLLEATEAGVDLAREAIVAVERCDSDFFSALGPNATKFQTLISVLDRHARRS